VVRFVHHPLELDDDRREDHWVGFADFLTGEELSGDWLCD
jgi:hypothetical protein